MEMGGRKPKPTLVYGGRGDGNVGIDLIDGSSDPASRGMFRAGRYRTNKSHVRAYQKLIEASSPPEDHDDRNALYALRVDLDVSCGWPANKRMRLLAMEEMQRLIDKHPDGFEGWEAQ